MKTDADSVKYQQCMWHILEKSNNMKPAVGLQSN